MALNYRSRRFHLRIFRNGHHNRNKKLQNFPSGPNNGNYKGGRIVKPPDNYIMTRCEGHPRASKRGHYVFEHVLAMEKHIGRYLKDNEIVHHINGNRQDNRIDNLELMKRGEHSTHHNNLRGKIVDMSDRKCIQCGKITHRKGWYRHPITDEEWICVNCYKVIKRALRKQRRLKSIAV